MSIPRVRFNLKIRRSWKDVPTVVRLAVYAAAVMIEEVESPITNNSFSYSDFVETFEITVPHKKTFDVNVLDVDSQQDFLEFVFQDKIIAEYFTYHFDMG